MDTEHRVVRLAATLADEIRETLADVFEAVGQALGHLEDGDPASAQRILENLLAEHEEEGLTANLHLDG